MNIVVSPMLAVEELARELRPALMLSLLEPALQGALPTPPEARRHVRLTMHDIDIRQVGRIAPNEEHIRILLAEADLWRPEQGPALIHCHAGISRSPAAAFVFLCRRNPQTDELAIARALRKASPTASPNERIIALADDMMGRRGRMIAAINRMPAVNLDADVTPFELAAPESERDDV